MKTYFNYYLIILAICFVIYNVIIWVIPSEVYGYQKTAGGFWPGYIFINAAIIAMVPCGYIASKSENKEKLFLNIPILTTSYIALICMFVAGTICMTVPGIADWVGIIVCLIILGIEVAALISAKAAASMVEEIGGKVEKKTEYMRELSVKAQDAISIANTDFAKKEAQRVYETIRYSDPVSDASLLELEAKLSTEFNKFVTALNSGRDDEISQASRSIQILLAERNNMCKAIK